MSHSHQYQYHRSASPGSGHAGSQAHTVYPPYTSSSGSSSPVWQAEHGPRSTPAAAKTKKKRKNPRRHKMEQEVLANLRRKDKERKRLRRNQMSDDERNRSRERDKERKAAKRREQRSRLLALSMKLPPVSSVLDGYPPSAPVPKPLQPLQPPPHFNQHRHHGHHRPPSNLPLPQPQQYSSSNYKHPVDR